MTSLFVSFSFQAIHVPGLLMAIKPDWIPSLEQMPHTAVSVAIHSRTTRKQTQCNVSMEVMSVQLCVKVGLQNDVARWIRIFDTY